MPQHQFIRMLTGGDLVVEAPVALEWRGRNGRALFALLAMRPGEEISRDRLAGLFWPESDQNAARANLRMTLLGLRRTLEPEDSGLLVVTSEAVRLNVGREDVDVTLFEMLSARSDAESRSKALSLYRGDLLAGLTPPSEAFDDLLRTERERLHALAIATGFELIAELEKQGAADRLGSVVRRLLTIDPASEPAHRAMMRAHMAVGDRAAALRQFDRCRATLRDHYDLEPSAETVALRDQIAETSVRAVPKVESPPTDDTAEDGDRGARKARRETAPAVRQARRKWHVLALATLVVIGVLFWSTWSGWGPPEDGLGQGAVQVAIAPIAAELSDCHDQNLKREVRVALEEALIAVPNVTVILQGTTGGAHDRSGQYVLEVHVQCRNTDFRVSLTVRHRSSDSADWVGQYDRDGRTLEEVVQRVVEDIRPLLERG